MKRAPRISVFLILIFSVAGLIAQTAWSIWTFAGVTPGAKAEVAIVLGASVIKNTPSPVYQARIDHAVFLYQNGHVNSVIVTGGKLPGSVLSDAEIARAYAVLQGVPPQDVFVEIQSRTTRENLLFAQRLAEAKGMTSCIVVSDSFHLKRAMLIAENLHMNCVPSATPSSRYKSWTSKVGFVSRETYFYFVHLLLGM